MVPDHRVVQRAHGLRPAHDLTRGIDSEGVTEAIGEILRKLRRCKPIPDVGEWFRIILLSDNLKLAGAVTVSAIERLPGQLHVAMFRTASPGDGSITLVFADNPLSLRQWTISDPQQRETSVSLFNIALGGRFDQKLFETADPRLRE